MKIMKYIFFLICMTIALLLTNELQVKYFTSELQMNDWSFHFDNSITDDIVEILEKLSEKNNVLVYANKQKISEQNITVYDIFENQPLNTCFQYAVPKKLKSIFLGTIQINENKLSDLHEIDETIYFRVKGDENNISKFIKELEQHANLYSLNSYITSYPEDCVKPVNILWLVIALFLLFVNYYQVSILKREKMIAICYGHSPALIMLKSILADLALIVPIAFISIFFMQKIFFIIINKKIISYSILIILTCVMPYFSYLKFNLKLISHENKLLEKIVMLSKIFKLIITCMLLGVVVSVSYASKSFIDSYNANSQMKKYLDYDIIRISNQDFSKVPEEILALDDTLAQSYANRIAINDLYSRYYQACDITILDRHYASDNNIEIEQIYCNGNAKDYIFSIFSDYIDKTENSDLIYFLPKNKNNSNNRIDSLRTFLKNYNTAENYSEKIIYYDNDNTIKICCFSSNPENLISIADNPYVILDNMPPEKSSTNYEKRLDMPALAIHKNNEFETEIHSKNNLNYLSYCLKDNILYMIETSKKELLILLFIVLVLLFLEIIMSYQMIAFDYRLHRKEYCLKRAFGSGMISKYKKQIIFLIAIYAISILVVCNLIHSNFYFVLILGVSLMLLDLLAILFFILQTEHKKVLAVLKGGFS